MNKETYYFKSIEDIIVDKEFTSLEDYLKKCDEQYKIELKKQTTYEEFIFK